jgi:3-deoxy-D-manno-octulosonic-acid transferase
MFPASFLYRFLRAILLTIFFSVFFLIYSLFFLFFLLTFSFVSLLFAIFSREELWDLFVERIRFGFSANLFGRRKDFARAKNRIWLHAVSVGEFFSVESIIDELGADEGNSVLVTVGTRSAYEFAAPVSKKFLLGRMPFDFFLLLLPIFIIFRPNSLVIVESDIWPGLLILSKLFGVKLFLLSARLRAKSPAKQFFNRLFLKVFLPFFDFVYLQSEHFLEQFRRLAGKNTTVSVFGDLKALNVARKHRELVFGSRSSRIKFGEDSRLYPDLFFDLSSGRRKRVLFASFHEEELEFFLFVLNRFCSTAANSSTEKPFFILAPRHFYWMNSLLSSLNSLGVRYSLLSELSGELSSFFSGYANRLDLLIVDKIGLLFDLYAYADVAVLGGTFCPVGGHSVTEPAVWGVPTIVGNYTFHIDQTIDRLASSGALIGVDSKPELYLMIVHLISFRTTTRISRRLQKSLLDISMEADLSKKKFIRDLVER